MVKKDENESCCVSNERERRCCRVEAVVTVDDRGQMVLPKDVRDKAKIRAGDKLAVMSWEKDGEVCCISLIKVGDLTEMIKSILGPVMKEILRE